MKISHSIHCFVAALMLFVVISESQAHLMAARHGTINFVDGGAFVVSSIPVAAIDGVDDDGDGKMSVTEFKRHRDQIRLRVRAGLQLLTQDGAAPLQGLIVNRVASHSRPSDPAANLILMGRFALPGDVDLKKLRLRISLIERAREH